MNGYTTYGKKPHRRNFIDWKSANVLKIGILGYYAANSVDKPSIYIQRSNFEVV